MVGINFADKVEAANFKEVLDNKLESKRQRRYERRSRVIENQNFGQNSHPSQINAVSERKVANGTGTTITSTYNFPTKKESKKLSKVKSKDKKKLFKKEDIGTPMNFRHVQHVGWDPARGFDLAGVDKDFEAFFQKAGVSHNQLEDEGTREFIYNFIETHGGVEAIKQEVTRVAPPPPPSISQSHNATNYPPPPVPARHPSIPSIYPTPVPGGKSAAPPPPPSRPVPPAPPPSTYPGAVPPPPVRTMNYSQQQSSSPKTSHKIGNGTAPPPPPPPPMGAGIPPPPPPLNMSYGQGDGESDSGFSSSSTRQVPQVESEDERSALMKQIQQGISLKRVDPDQAKKPPASLSDCLNQIKTGVDLKRVPESAKHSAPPGPDVMDGLAGALARALAERSRAINPDSSDSDAEEEPFDEDEWD
jgi:Wiskott-Aldrich syndrome protein